jgi:hypothetical protein
MPYNATDFDSTVQTLGQKYSQPENLGRNIKLALTAPDFQFADQSTAEAQTSWQAGINEEKIFILPFIYENEDNSEEAVMQDFTGGDSLQVRKGRYAERNRMHLSVSDMAKLASYKNKNWRMFKIDSNGYILGTTPDGTVMQGFELTTFDIEKMNNSAGDVKRLVPIFYKEREPDEWTDRPVALNVLGLSSNAWDPRDLDGLIDVELTVNTAASTNINVTATAYLKGVALAGFDQVSDWVLAVGQTITGVTDNGDGTYDLAGTGLVSGTINLAEPEDLSQDGYKSTGAQTVTI